ncbi:MAG: HD-GYP domain-containing protein, partial [Candidatus Dormibacteraceae bacterium]
MSPVPMSPAGSAGAAALERAQVNRASLVLRMARVATCTHSLSIMLRATLNEFDREGIRAGLIVLADDPHGLYLAAAEANRERTALIGRLTSRPGVIGRVAEIGRSVIVADLAASDAEAAGYELPLNEVARSLAVVPVRASRRVVGLLAMDSCLPDAFTEYDLEILEDVALAISGALQAVRLKSVQDRLDNTQRVIFSLARAVEAKDRFTEAHTERVAATARMLGECAGLASKDLDDLYCGGLIHDIGKTGVPDAILLKPG